MKTLLILVLPAIATAYLCYVTIQGYRTDVLNLRGRFDRRVAPRMFFLMLVLATVLCLVCLGAVALLAYGETHPEWRGHAKQHADNFHRISRLL